MVSILNLHVRILTCSPSRNKHGRAPANTPWVLIVSFGVPHCRNIAITLKMAGAEIECNGLSSTVTVRNKDWLIKIAVRRQEPSHFGESCLFQNAAQFTPKHRTIGRGEMERVPR